MRNKFIKLLAWVCIGISFIAMTSCNGAIGSEPMLKITTSTENRMNLNPKTTYYIVYENGAVKKTDEFVLADVNSYSSVSRNPAESPSILNDFDVNTSEGAELYEIASNTLILMNETKLKNISVYRLFVHGERYFFVGDCDNKSDYLFEYIIADNSIKEIASVNKGSINHVELYRP